MTWKSTKRDTKKYIEMCGRSLERDFEAEIGDLRKGVFAAFTLEMYKVLREVDERDIPRKYRRNITTFVSEFEKLRKQKGYPDRLKEILENLIKSYWDMYAVVPLPGIYSEEPGPGIDLRTFLKYLIEEGKKFFDTTEYEKKIAEYDVNLCAYAILTPEDFPDCWHADNDWWGDPVNQAPKELLEKAKKAIEKEKKRKRV